MGDVLIGEIAKLLRSKQIVNPDRFLESVGVGFILLENKNLSEFFQTINLLVVQFCDTVLIVISHFTIELHGSN